MKSKLVKSMKTQKQFYLFDTDKIETNKNLEAYTLSQINFLDTDSGIFELAKIESDFGFCKFKMAYSRWRPIFKNNKNWISFKEFLKPVLKSNPTLDFTNSR